MLQQLLVIVAGTLAAAGEVSAAPAPKAPDRVGHILLVGNNVTPSRIILGRVPLTRGQVLNYTDLRAAERNLRWLNPLGIGATVEVIDPQGANPYKDIVVTVQETLLTHVLIEVPDTLLSWLRGR